MRVDFFGDRLQLEIRGTSMKSWARLMPNWFYLWRAVGQSGDVLDVLVQKCLNSEAGRRFFQKLLKPLRYALRTMAIDELAIYDAAKQNVMRTVAVTLGRLNNRAENSTCLLASESEE